MSNGPTNFEPYEAPTHALGLGGDDLASQPLSWLNKVRWGVILALIAAGLPVIGYVLRVPLLFQLSPLVALVSVVLISFVPPDATRRERWSSWAVRGGLVVALLAPIVVRLILGAPAAEESQPPALTPELLIASAFMLLGMLGVMIGQASLLGCYAHRDGRPLLAKVTLGVGIGLVVFMIAPILVAVVAGEDLQRLAEQAQDQADGATPQVTAVTTAISVLTLIFITLAMTWLVVLIQQMLMFQRAISR